MTDADLEQSYTALSHALAEVGEDKAALLLSMVCLQLMARQAGADDVLPLIANALAQAQAPMAGAAHGG